MRMSEEAFAAHQKRVKEHPPVGNRAARLERAPGTRNRGLRKRRQPNKTEAAFGAFLAARQHGMAGILIGFESISLTMPGGTRYTPDWAFYQQAGETEYDYLCLYEVKGFMREAARVRLKEFAAHFSCFRFFLVRAKNRQLTDWDIQEL